MGRQWAALATTQRCFVVLWRVISQLSARLKEPSNLNVSLQAFPRTTSERAQRHTSFQPIETLSCQRDGHISTADPPLSIRAEHASKTLQKKERKGQAPEHPGEVSDWFPDGGTFA